MAMTFGGSSGSRSYSYTVTETYTLEEAVAKASNGELDPAEVYRQVPQPLQEEIDRLASHQFSQRFMSLSLSHQRQVMQALKMEIEQAKENPEKPLSIVEAMQMAKAGTLDDVKLYEALPEELRKILDGLAEAQNAAGFSRATPEARKQIWGFVLEMLNAAAAQDAQRRTEEQAKQRAQEEAQRRAEEQAKQRAQEEAQRRVEEQAKQRAQEEAQRRAVLEAKRRSAKQCILCGDRLGFVHRLSGRERHPECTVWKG
jgi:septum formation inhibitor MinC